MMAERLQGYRMDVNNPNTKGFVPGVVRELLDHIAQLEAHKAESMQVFAALQIQEIAKEIGAPLGSGAPEQILPWIKTAKAQLEAQADELSATMERLSGVVERYRNGMQPSSAERCALRWSHSSATDRGSFERGWEAREAEGLEAQRGELARELDLTKREAWTAKERHKDEKDRADGLRERLDELSAEEFARAQRGGAVVVPELTDIELSACERLARMCRKSPSLVEGYLDDIKPWEAAEAIEKAATRQAIPANQVLADGMVGVDREAITRLSTAIDDVVITSAHHAIGSIEDKAVSVLCMAFSSIAKALRAQQAKGE